MIITNLDLLYQLIYNKSTQKFVILLVQANLIIIVLNDTRQ